MFRLGDVKRPLLRLAVTGFRAHAVRLVLTGFAVMVGVGFLAGTLVYGDTARAAFYDDLARSARGVDVAVEPAALLAERDTVDTIAALDGVAAVDGRMAAWLSMLDRDGKLMMDHGHVGYGLSVPDVPSMAAYDLLSGRLPRGPGELAVEKATVERAGFTVGGPVTVLDAAGQPRTLTLVGVLDLGVNRLYGGSTVAALTDAELTALTGTERFAEVVVAAKPGVSATLLRDRVAAALGHAYPVLTGAQLRQKLAVEAGKYVTGFVAVLLGFGLVAVTVSAFVIYNTFAILAAQRARELALLRAIGATRRQVTGTVLIEALLLGLVASVGGLVMSVVIGYGLIWGRELVATDIPLHTPVVRWPTFLVAVGFGTFVAVVSALVPAISAGRVAPLAALRDASLSEPRAVAGGRRTARLVASALLAALGLLAVVGGVPLGFPGLPLVLGGGMLLFVAAVVAGPLIVPPLVAMVGWVPVRLFGTVPALAVANARRNPRRAAATTLALVIGVALMSLFAVLLATARDQSGKELTENFPVEFTLNRARTDGTFESMRAGMPPGLAPALRKHSAFATVAEVRSEAPLAGDRTRVSAVPPDQLRGAIRPEVTAGTLNELGPGTVALNRGYAADQGLTVGSTVPFGTLGPLRVVALFDDSPLDGSALVSFDTFTTAYGDRPAVEILVDLAPGVSTEDGRRLVDAELRAYPVVQVTSRAAEADELAASLDELLGIFAALLGISVLISLFGIGNTLSLSVVERRRESATMRAFGLSRRQLGGMLLLESGLIAVVGAVAGVALGGGVGWVAAAALIDTYGHGVPVIPVGQLTLVVLAAAGAALLAAVLPARRAARLPVIAALADD
ncbi:membrane protein [Asanoa ferruginea]|nr:membrane protein [Asanoa ferruginea]